MSDCLRMNRFFFFEKLVNPDEQRDEKTLVGKSFDFGERQIGLIKDIASLLGKVNSPRELYEGIKDFSINDIKLANQEYFRYHTLKHGEDATLTLRRI